MSSRHHGSTPAQFRKNFAIYKKLRSSTVEDGNDAPEYICVPVEQAYRQAVTPVAPSHPANSTPGKHVKEAVAPAPQVRGRRESTPEKPDRTPRRRTPAPEKHVEWLPTPMKSSSLTGTKEVGSLRGSLRTPPPPRRVSLPNAQARGSVIPKEKARVGIDEDGRGSPEERRRKSDLAKNLPRRPDGKFASTKKKSRRPAEEDGYQSEFDTSDDESFRGNPKRKSKLTTPLLPAVKTGAPIPATRDQQRGALVKKEPLVEEVSHGEESKAVATRPKRVISLQFGSKKDGRNESVSSSSSQSGDSFNGITEYHKTINNTTNVVVISDSSIGTQSSRSSDGEE